MIFELLANYAARGDPDIERTRSQRVALLALAFLAFLLLYSAYALLAAGVAFLIIAFVDTQTALHASLFCGAVGVALAVIVTIWRCSRMYRLLFVSA